MGKELYAASDLFRNAIDQMQRSLNSLPADDRPDWSLVDQLEAPSETSRVGEAAVSQPLCTALQVALVTVLRAAGVDHVIVALDDVWDVGAVQRLGEVIGVSRAAPMNT